MKTLLPRFRANFFMRISRSLQQAPHYRTQILIVILIALASSCTGRPAAGTDNGGSPPSETAAVPTDAAPPPSTQLSVPPTPAFVLVADEGRVANDFSVSLSAALADQGMELLVLPEEESRTLPEEVQYILAYSAPSAAGLRELNPDLPIIILDASVAVDSPTPGIRFSESFYRNAAFAAGNLAAIITPEYRIGYIDLVGQEISGGFTSFSNGVIYYCGLCSPQYPPFIPYPVYTQLSSPYTSENINSVIESLQGYKVTTVYLHPFLYSSELAQNLENAGILSISTELLISQIDGEQTAIAFSPDYADTAYQLVTLLLSDEGLGELSPGVIISAGYNLIGEGKMKHLEEVLNMLEIGLIMPIE